MYMHILSVLRNACPESEAVFLSQRDRKAAEELLEGYRTSPRQGDDLTLPDINESQPPMSVEVIYDHDGCESEIDIGPAAGLLAAYRKYPSSTWLVVACDYPLLTSSALMQLRQEVTVSVTCFRNEDGFCEPLLGIWTPDALGVLEENVRNGILGPSSVVRRMGETIQPRESRWLFNTNTPEEWEEAMRMMES